MLIAELLKHVARQEGNQDRLVQSLAKGTDREFLWALDAGLGPLLLDAAGSEARRIPAGRRNQLLSADLTARVLHETRVAAALEVIETCASAGVDVTLLKGISTSEQFYAAGHHRRMSDIDILVLANDYAVLEAALLEQSFERGPDELGDSGAHGTPLMHRDFKVWLEIHRTLFPPSSGLRWGRTFDSENIARQTVDSEFRGRPVRRLSPTFQWVYIAAYWMRDIVCHPPHPTHLTALIDTACLLRSSPVPDWSGPDSEWFDNDLSRAALNVLLSYLAAHTGIRGPAPPAPRSGFWRVGAVERRAIHAMLDTCLLGARSWRAPLPPPVPGRYSIRRQFLRRRTGTTVPMEW